MATLKNTKYATTVTTTGGREGHAVSDDGVLDVQLRRPKTNGVAEGTNPEQLFAAAWGACWQQALISIAGKEDVDASGSTVKVEVRQGEDEAGGFGLAAKIDVTIPGVNDAKAKDLADQAHDMCPYSKATRGNVDVDITAHGA